jgi:hypothetical protein
MAAANPVPVPRATGGEKRVIAFLRELREEIQYLQEGLEKVKAAVALTDPQARIAVVGAALESKERFDRSQLAIDQRLSAVQDVFRESEGLHANYGDVIVEIGNRWETIAAHWPKGDEEAAKLLARITEVDQEMARIVYLCALLTVPERVNQNLAAMRVGQAMDFRMQFKDEVPDEAQGKKILEYLGLHPNLVNGLVDIPSGVVYRSSASPARRWASIGAFAVFLALPVAVMYIPGLLAAMGVTTPVKSLLQTYAGIAAGSFVHIAITMLKQQRSGNSGSVILLTDWLLWVHVKETAIVFGIVSLWVALIGLIALPNTLTAGMSGAFFVGYSLDSFVDLFLSRFETTASNAVEAARAKLTAA